jgi:hypothetical protein
VDCDDVMGWMGVGGKDDVGDDVGIAIGRAGGVFGRIVCLVGAGWSSSSLLLK